MIKKKISQILLISIVISIAAIAMSLSLKDTDPETTSRNNNICGKLQGNVMVYIIFSETKESFNWTDFDINSAIDTINIATNWLEKQAKANNVDLRITVDYFQTDSLNSVYASLGGTPKRLISKPEGVEKIHKWSDKIVRIASGNKTKEKFIADLRDQNNIGSVALVYMVNNFFKSEYAFSFNTTNTDRIEYSVMGTKMSKLIAQEVLHLFGAPYLYSHPSTNNRRNAKQLQSMFPDDIMSNSDKNINSLNIGEITKYYIGWTNDLDTDKKSLVKEGRSKI